MQEEGVKRSTVGMRSEEEKKKESFVFSVSDSERRTKKALERLFECC